MHLQYLVDMLMQDIDIEVDIKLEYDLLCDGTTGGTASLCNLVEQKTMDLLPKDDELRLLEGVMVVLEPFKNTR